MFKSVERTNHTILVEAVSPIGPTKESPITVYVSLSLLRDHRLP
jgi:hypothetical protein